MDHQDVQGLALPAAEPDLGYSPVPAILLSSSVIRRQARDQTEESGYVLAQLDANHALVKTRDNTPVVWKLRGKWCAPCQLVRAPDPIDHIRVRTSIWSADRWIGTREVTGWMAKASDEMLIALAAKKWECDPGSPEFESLRKFGELTTDQDVNGYGLHQTHAMEWLRHYRAGVWAQIVCAAYNVRIQASPDNAKRWEWAYVDGSGVDFTHPRQAAFYAAIAVLGLPLPG